VKKKAPKENNKKFPRIDVFKKLSESQSSLLLFSDEVGRGPLAGPVVACTVALFVKQEYKNDFSPLVKESFLKWRKFLKSIGSSDSKKISASERGEVLKKLGIAIDQLRSNTVYDLDVEIFSCNLFEIKFVLVEKSPRYIDEVNILNASLGAMAEGGQRILEDGSQFKIASAGVWFIDGNKKLRQQFAGIDQQPIIKGDLRVPEIGLASIIAKQYRDNLMQNLANHFPQYGFEKHAGYPTKQHLEALQIYGATSIHRKTFRGVPEWKNQQELN